MVVAVARLHGFLMRARTRYTFSYLQDVLGF